MRASYQSIPAVAALIVVTATASGQGNLVPPTQVKPTPIMPGGDGRDPSGDSTFRSDACPATDVGVLASDGSVTIVGNNCGSHNNFENDGPECNAYGALGRDEIYQFTVDQTGIWELNTTQPCAGWDTSLMVREETGGGCPGVFVACDGDSGDGVCGWYESWLQVFLSAGPTYYLVVDGWEEFECGAIQVSPFLAPPECADDADCADGVFCNGAETCNVGTGECVDGAPPCASYQSCDETGDTCVDPDPCASWLGGSIGTYSFPYVNHDPGAWLADDIELERGCTEEPAVLEYYEIPIIARDNQNPVGTLYTVDLALWEVGPSGDCMPSTQIPGSQCFGLVDDIDPAGSPPDIFRCVPPGPVELPDNSGDYMRCEIDFFVGYVGTDLGIGFNIAASDQPIGGPGASDEFGVNVFFLEDFAGAGTFYASWFGDDVNMPADFAEVVVCTDNHGVCCGGLGTCTEGVLESECSECTDDWTPCVFWDPPVCDDADGDGIATPCDNCDLPNPDQADCQPNGIGDVCDIAYGPSEDCNDNGIPDECEIDCNENGIPDECDLCTDDNGPEAAGEEPYPGLEQAVVDGLAYLAGQQNADGSWSGGSCQQVATTALVVLKLEDRALDLGYLDPMDPGFLYHQEVTNGLAYITSHSFNVNISSEPAADGDGDGVGLIFKDCPGDVHDVYPTALTMMALAASRHPELYTDLLQDAMDWMVFAQNNSACGINRGGWGYGANDCGWSDNSNGGYASLGLGFAAASAPHGFALSLPQFVLDELNLWVDALQDPVNGDANDGGSHYAPGDGWVNILKTGNLLYEMGMVGDTPGAQRVQHAIDYIERHWNGAGGCGVGWRDHRQAMFAMMKGLEGLNIDLLDLAGDGTADDDWFAEVAAHLVSTQQADGSWPNDCWGGSVLSTAWALLTLERAVAPPRPTGACCDRGALVCEDDVFEEDCGGEFDEWTEGGQCADVAPSCVPLECSLDCNLNEVPDECEIAVNSPAPGGPFFCTTACDPDCNINAIPDECETDCQPNDVPDDCDIRDGTSPDCNGNGVPDECDIASGTSKDATGNGVPDECEAVRGDSDWDGDVDLDDYFAFEICLSVSGPGQVPPFFFRECRKVFDFDDDNDVDVGDFARFQAAFTGP